MQRHTQTHTHTYKYIILLFSYLICRRCPHPFQSPSITTRETGLKIRACSIRSGALKIRACSIRSCALKIRACSIWSGALMIKACSIRSNQVRLHSDSLLTSAYHELGMTILEWSARICIPVFWSVHYSALHRFLNLKQTNKQINK